MCKRTATLFNYIDPQKSGEHVQAYITKMLGKEEWTITLDQAKFIHWGVLTRELPCHHMEECQSLWETGMLD